MIPYILYAGLVLAACFAFYKLLLQKETFFRLNRFVLLVCMAIAFILPLLPVPQEWSFRKAETPVTEFYQQLAYANNAPEVLSDNTPSSNPVSSKEIQAFSFEQALKWIIYLYWFGVIIFALNFLLQAVVLLYKAYTLPVIKDGRFRIVEVTGDKAPCSFGNNIFINPAKYDWETYNQVLLHEKIHVEQRHTLDLLLTEVVLIFQWFNPFAWLWRKELEKNLEFLTDDNVLKYDTIEKASYQVSLLKVTAPNLPLSLTTNYNQSLLKKRLLMMNAKKSNMHTIWKYFFLLPLMVLFVCLFNEPLAISQTDENRKSTMSKNDKDDNHNDLRTEGNWFATIKGDKVNIQFRSDNDENSYNGNTFLLSEFKDLPRDKTGTFTLTREAGTMEFTGKFEGDKGMGNYKFVPDKTYSSDMQKEGIDVAKDGDMMVFFFVNIKRSYVEMLKQNGYTGLDRDDIIPLAALDINEIYIKSIKEAGFPNISTEDLIPFRSLGVDKDYIEEIRKAGYPDISPDKIISFKAQGIDGKYIADFRSSVGNNVDDKQNKNQANNSDQSKSNIKEDDEDAMISYKALGIDNNYIQSLEKAGYHNLSSEDVISMKAIGITPEYIKGFQDAGITNIPAEELVALKAQDISPATVKQYKTLGLGSVDIEDVVSAKATGTTPALISEYKALGFKDLDLDDIISAKSTGTTPAIIREYRSLGFKDLSLDDIISAKATGTTPAVIKEYRSLGFKDLSLDDIISAKATGTTPAVIKEYRSLGFKDLDLDDIISAKSTGATPALIRDYSALGFEGLDLDDIVSAVATGTTPSFITSMRQKGHNMKSLEKYVTLKTVLE